MENLTNPVNCSMGYTLVIDQNDTMKSIEIIKLPCKVPNSHYGIILISDNPATSLQITTTIANLPQTAEFAAQLAIYIRTFIYETEQCKYDLPMYFEPLKIIQYSPIGRMLRI
jgi:hypothetical protein